VILHGVTLTPALAAWIAQAHDDGQPELRATSILRGGTYGTEVTRGGGSELSPTEEREVRALLAAHAVEPLRIPR